MGYSYWHQIRCDRVFNRDGSTSWFKLLKALNDLGGCAKAGEIYKLAFGEERKGSNSNGLFAGMNGNVMNYNKSTQCWEINDKGLEKIAEYEDAMESGSKESVATDAAYVASKAKRVNVEPECIDQLKMIVGMCLDDGQDADDIRRAVTEKIDAWRETGAHNQYLNLISKK